MNEIVKKEYYVEFGITGGDIPFVMQSKWFQKPQHALLWIKQNLPYIDDDKIGVYIMVANYINEDDFDIRQFCRVINYELIF